MIAIAEFIKKGGRRCMQETRIRNEGTENSLSLLRKLALCFEHLVSLMMFIYIYMCVCVCVAFGEIYGGEETLAPLKALFPKFYFKETIASKEELTPFSSFFSRMAVLDFMVCDESGFFLSNNNGII